MPDGTKAACTCLSTSSWERIHVDFAGPFLGRMFMVIVDAHSKWPEVIEMKSTTAERTNQELRTIFARYGLPRQCTAIDF